MQLLEIEFTWIFINTFALWRWFVATHTHLHNMHTHTLSFAVRIIIKSNMKAILRNLNLKYIQIVQEENNCAHIDCSIILANVIASNQ